MGRVKKSGGWELSGFVYLGGSEFVTSLSRLGEVHSRPRLRTSGVEKRRGPDVPSVEE